MASCSPFDPFVSPSLLDFHVSNKAMGLDCKHCRQGIACCLARTGCLCDERPNSGCHHRSAWIPTMFLSWSCILDCAGTLVTKRVRKTRAVDKRAECPIGPPLFLAAVFSSFLRRRSDRDGAVLAIGILALTSIHPASYLDALAGRVLFGTASFLEATSRLACNCSCGYSHLDAAFGQSRQLDWPYHPNFAQSYLFLCLFAHLAHLFLS